MRIWLINPYGPIPGESWRAYRFDNMARVLAGAGHDVVWWTSSFSHHFKTFRSTTWKDLSIDSAYVIRLVPTTGYSSNQSPKRLIKDWLFAIRTYARGTREVGPDLIVHAESPLTFGLASYSLARIHACPIIYDQMDLWPEFILSSMPRSIRPLAKVLCQPIYWRRRQLYKKLDGAIALAQPYLEAIFNEVPGLNIPSRVIYNGIDVEQLRTWMSAPARDHRQGEPSGYRAIFAGTLGPSYDIHALIQAAQQLASQQSSVRILVAGDGPLADTVAAAAAACGHLIYLGKLSPEDLAAVYRSCDAGLAAYSDRSNVEMPDKFYDYTAAGLVIVNSLNGEVAARIAQHAIGIQYEAGNAGDLVRKLNLLAGDPALQATMRRNSSRVAMRYDALEQYRMLPDLIDEVIACRNARSAGTSAR